MSAGPISNKGFTQLLSMYCTAQAARALPHFAGEKMNKQSQHLAVGPAAFLIFFTFSTGAILACLLVLFPFPPRNSSAAGNHVFSCKAINSLYRNYLSQFKFRVIRLMTACKRVHMRCNFKQSFNKPDHFYISCTLETLDSHIYMEEVKSVLCRTVGKHALCLLLHSDCENCSFE